VSVEKGRSRLTNDRMPLVTKVARMYHEQNLLQPEIADRLHMSQSRVSRLLTEAVALGIVRTIVIAPLGVYSDLEEAICVKYGLRDVLIAESSSSDESAIMKSLGSAAAAYLESTLNSRDRIGIAPWSETILAVVDAISPRTRPLAQSIVQVFGGIGDPAVQLQSSHLIDRLARVTGGNALYLSAPGLVANSSVRDALLADGYIAEVANQWPNLTALLVGIGSLQPSPLLFNSGNAISESEQQQLRKRGAVGDVCLRFYDEDGHLVKTGLEDRVLGISVETLRAVPRRIGVAGGRRKHEAIRAALRGGWVNVLITDADTGRFLISDFH